MTRQRNDDNGTPFEEWRRRHPALTSNIFDAEDIDFVWFNYREGWLMLIEEKRRNANQSFAQKDTHGLIDQMLKFSSAHEFKTAKGLRPIDYLGYFLVQFENTDPENSKWIKINGRMSNKHVLVFLLRYGILLDREMFKEPLIPLPLTESLSTEVGFEITPREVVQLFFT